MDKITPLNQHFKDAAIYGITIPNSHEFKLLLAPSSMEAMNHDYSVFMDVMKDRVRAFLEQEGEDSRVGREIIQDLFGPMHVTLEFRCRPQVMEKLKASLEGIFEDLKLADEHVKQGASWKHLPIASFASGPILNPYSP